jgi:hypothetical protein
VRIALDIETNLAHDKIWICSTYNVDTKEAKKWLSPTNEFQNYIQTAEMLIAHNGISFDFPVLNRVWNTRITLKQIRDTLVLSRLANPSREGGHSLGKLATLVGRTKKEFDDFDGGLTDEMAEYCQMDAEICGELYLYLLKELKGFSEQSIELEHKVAAIISKQEKQGFLLDVVKATTLIADWKCRLSQIEEELQSIFPPIVTERTSEKTGKVLKDQVEYFNAGSRQQIAKRLMEKGWKPTKHTEKGAVIVDESVLSGVDIPEAKAIAEYLLLQKRVSQVSSWLDAVQPDGRVRGKVITNGAISGRATHHSPNMAQIPNIGSEFGKGLMADIETQAKSGQGIQEIGRNISNSLAYAIVQGVITTDQAKSISAALGEELKSYKIPAIISGRLTSLLGPNGENLATDPLKVTLAIQEESLTRQADFFKTALESIKPTIGVSTQTIMAGSTLAGAAIGSAIPGVGTVIGAGVGAGIGIGTAALNNKQQENNNCRTGCGACRVTLSISSMSMKDWRISR